MEEIISQFLSFIVDLFVKYNEPEKDSEENIETTRQYITNSLYQIIECTINYNKANIT